MRRTIATIGMAGALVVGQGLVAGPAAAAWNCTIDLTGQMCRGGGSETFPGAGGAGGRTLRVVTGEYTYSGGGGVPGGGFGERCTGNRLTDEERCVGSAYTPRP